MQGDQASGLRQWSQRLSETASGQAISVDKGISIDNETPVGQEILVVMGWGLEDTPTGDLAHRLNTLPAPSDGMRWQLQPMELAGTLPPRLPTTAWWVLWLPNVKSDQAASIARALRQLRDAGMPSTVLLLAESHIDAQALITAAQRHLGITLLQDVADWQQRILKLSES